MRKMTLKEVQGEELRLFERLTAWCDRHGARYYLVADLLLGVPRGSYSMG